jgi:hypothetical protein
MMAEKVCVFGPSLVGILSQRVHDGPLFNAPAILLWNVGMNHHVGPYRFFVDLSRKIAENSGTVLRFDVSGLGDSELQPGRGSDLDRAILDIGEAMTLIEKRTNIREFVLVGFCSGVDAAHRVAVTDNRVVGVVQIEGYAYRTPGFYRNMYRRLTNLLYWERYINRKGSRLKKLIQERIAPETKTTTNGSRELEPVFSRVYPTREQYRDDIAALARRNVGQFFLYVGSGSDFIYNGQFDEMYGSRDTKGAVDVAFYEDADHTFFRLADRERAVGVIIDWLTKRYGER